MAFIHTTFYRLYLHWCILNAYSLYFVLSLHTRDSDWTVSKTHEQTRNTFNQIFAYLSLVLYTTIMKNVNLRNILVNITENYGRLEHLSGQNKSKILTFSIRRLEGRNDVLNETRMVEILEFPCACLINTSGSQFHGQNLQRNVLQSGAVRHSVRMAIHFFVNFDVFKSPYLSQN